MIAAAPIRLLPPVVADAIAAGEVVERPASVVKELCENALDAGARRIDVDVEGGGLVRIRVSDDGQGIAADQLPLAVARHATSKIADAGDLERIHSLGFRGEALASIAAVADVVLVSRTANADAGARLRVRAAETLDAGPVAAAPGTTVEVRDLFSATPARLRFLRSPRAEAAACTRVVADLALTHPEVALGCRNEGRTGVRTPGGILRDALRAVLGPAAAELVEISGAGDVAISGAISEPRAHRAARDGLVLVVNRRRVHNRSLLFAIEEAYRGLLPGGRHPYGLVAVDLDAAMVDVNVHPAKREVRFREEGRVFAAVQRACWEAVQGGRAYSASPVWDAVPGEAEASPAATLAVRDAAGERPGPTMAAPARGAVVLGTAPALGDTDESGPGAGVAGLAPLLALGQSGSAWMVAESPLGVVLVDPHAAHEKVVYAELLAAWDRPAAAVASQLLLIPAVVECDAERLARLEANAELVAAAGFAVETFGPGLVRCTAVPVASAASDAGRLVRDLLDTLDAAAAPASERRHRVAALVACHAAVRFGDALGLAEQQRLLDRLAVTPGGLTCPHGRPTVMLLDDAALRRAFRRP